MRAPIQGIYKKEIMVIGLLLLLTITFFEEGLIGKGATLIWDASDYFYPVLAFNAKSIHDGGIPLWNPMIFNGYPSFADPQAQTFYPINYLVALFVNFTPKVLYGLIVFHYFLAGFFMYLLCRYFKYDGTSSFVASLTYMFSGFLLGHFQHVTMIYSVAYFPLVFLFLDQALTDKSFACACMGSIFFAICILAGHPQSYFYICFVLAIHFLYKIIVSLRQERHSIWLTIQIGLFFGGCGLMLSMIQLVPTIELMHLSTRDVERTLQSSGLGVNWINMITLFMPNYLGGISGEGYFHWNTGVDISQQNMYMGVLTFFLILVAIIFSKDKTRIYFAVFTCFALLISMGTHTPLFSFFFHFVPGFSLFRHIGHFLFVFHFFVALLVAQGMKTLCREPISIRILAVFASLFLFSVVVFHLLLPDPPTAIKSFSTPINSLKSFFCIYGALVVILFGCLIGNKKKWFPYLLIVLLVFDLFWLTKDAITLGSRKVDNKIQQSLHEMMEGAIGIGNALKQHAGMKTSKLLYDLEQLDLVAYYPKNDFFRIYVSHKDRPFKAPEDAILLQALGFNRSILHGLFLVDGYSPLVLKRHRTLSQHVGNINMKRLVDLVNAKYHLFMDGNKTNIAIHKEPLQRVMVFEKADCMLDDQLVLEKLSQPEFNPRHTVIIEGRKEDLCEGNNENQAIINKEIQTSTIDILTYLPNRIDISVEAREECFLLLNETFYPGWKVLVDQQERTVLRANYNFKAVKLTAGKHNVSFVFRPNSLKLGGLLSTIAILLLTVVGVGMFIKGKRQRIENTSN